MAFDAEHINCCPQAAAIAIEVKRVSTGDMFTTMENLAKKFAEGDVQVKAVVVAGRLFLTGAAPQETNDGAGRGASRDVIRSMNNRTMVFIAQDLDTGGRMLIRVCCGSRKDSDFLQWSAPAIRSLSPSPQVSFEVVTRSRGFNLQMCQTVGCIVEMAVRASRRRMARVPPFHISRMMMRGGSSYRAIKSHNSERAGALCGNTPASVNALPSYPPHRDGGGRETDRPRQSQRRDLHGRATAWNGCTGTVGMLLCLGMWMMLHSSRFLSPLPGTETWLNLVKPLQVGIDAAFGRGHFGESITGLSSAIGFASIGHLNATKERFGHLMPHSKSLFASGYAFGRRGHGRGRDGIRIPSVGAVPAKQGSFYLAFACIVKNEQRYLEEWIEYGRLVGAEHFYVYLNECDETEGEPSRPVLAPYEERGWVTVVKWCIPAPLQIPAFNDALSRFGEHTKWMAFVDIDEYVVPQESAVSGSNTLQTLLPPFEIYGGLYVHWLLFGANGHVERPDASTMVSYTSRLRQSAKGQKHEYGKSFVRPGRAVFNQSIHVPMFHQPYFGVDTDHIPLRQTGTRKDKAQRVTHTMLAINHYQTRSKEEYIAKNLRGRAHSSADYQVCVCSVG